MPLYPAEDQGAIMESIAQFDPFDTSLRPSSNTVMIAIDCLPTADLQPIEQKLNKPSLKSLAVYQTLISWRHLITYPKNQDDLPGIRRTIDTLSAAGFPSARVCLNGSVLEVRIRLCITALHNQNA